MSNLQSSFGLPKYKHFLISIYQAGWWNESIDAVKAVNANLERSMLELGKSYAEIKEKEQVSRDQLAAFGSFEDFTKLRFAGCISCKYVLMAFINAFWHQFVILIFTCRMQAKLLEEENVRVRLEVS